MLSHWWRFVIDDDSRRRRNTVSRLIAVSRTLSLIIIVIFSQSRTSFFLPKIENSLFFQGFGNSLINQIAANFRDKKKKMAQAVEEWYKQMPIITRTYLTAAIVTTIGCSLDVFLSLSHCLLMRFCFVFNKEWLDLRFLGF